MKNEKEDTSLALTALLFDEEWTEQQSVYADLADLLEASESSETTTKPRVSLDISSGGKCPICDNKVRNEYADGENGMTCESRDVCDVCGLTTFFAYGSTETFIEEFGWSDHYGTKPTREEVRERDEEEALVMRMYRKICVDKEELTEAENAQLDALAEKMEARRQ